MEVMNALEARDRCLAAIPGLEKVEDMRALWRAAAKYNQLAKEIETSAAQVIAGSLAWMG